MTGATGQIYGIRLLEVLRNRPDVETHLIMSPWAEKTLLAETAYSLEAVKALATKVYPIDDLGAALSSGSFKRNGMVIAPCSVKTLSAVANSFNINLIVRAADVCLKEKKPVVLMVRETPLHLGHLRLMVRVSEVGATVLPPIPAFYNRPQTLDDIINQSVGRALDILGIEHGLCRPWQGMGED